MSQLTDPPDGDSVGSLLGLGWALKEAGKQPALACAAAALVVAHNHPSGVCEPSMADQAITRRLKDALDLLDIRLLDHFVVGDGQPVSMAARGLI